MKDAMVDKFNNVRQKYSTYFNNMEHHLAELSVVLSEGKNGRVKTAGHSSSIMIKVVTELSRLLPLVSIETLKGKEDLTKAQKDYICNGILKFLDDIFDKMNKTIPLLRDSNIDDQIYAAIRPSIQEFIICNLDRFNLASCCCI